MARQCNFVLLCFVVFFTTAYAKGVLHVDTVFSSSESRIVVDNMSGVLGETGHAETHEVEFANFASLGISAPQLDFHGSYFSVETVNDAMFTSTNDTINLIGGHNIDVNAKFVDIIGHFIDVQSAGEILLLARDDVTFNSDNTLLVSGDGGASFSSLAGDVYVNSPSSIDFDSFDALSMRATDNLSLISTGNSIFTADENIFAFTDNIASIDSSTSISMVSSVSSVKFDSHDLSLTLGSMFATGGGQALLQSFGDQLSVYGYTGVNMTSFGDINASGSSDGATFIATGDDGAVVFDSQAGSALFMASGASGHASAHVEADNFHVNVQDFQTTSAFDTSITGDRNMRFEASSVGFDIRRDAYVFNERTLSYSAGTSFGLTADFIGMSTDDSTVAMNAALVDTTVGNLLSMTSNNFNFAAEQGDFVIIAGDDIAIKGDFTDGRRQVISMDSGAFTLTGGDLDLTGGHVFITAEDVLSFTSAEDLNIQAANSKFASEVNFSAEDELTLTASSWRHNSGDVLFTNDNTLLFSEGSFSFEDISFTTTGVHDIDINASLDSTLTALDDIELNIGRDLIGSLSDDWSITSGLNDITLNTSDFYASADVFNAEVQFGQTIEFISAADTIITTTRNENTDDQLSFDFGADVTVSADNIIASAPGIAVFSAGDTIDVSSKDFTLSSGTLAAIDINAGDVEINVVNALTIEGNSLLFDSALDLNVSADEVDFTASQHGIDMSAVGNFDFIATTFTVDTNQEILVTSVGATTFAVADTMTVDSTEHNWIHSGTGNIDISAIESFVTTSARNMTLSTGDHTGDTFLINASTDASINSNDIFAMDVVGALTFTANAGPISFDSTEHEMYANINIDVTSPMFTATGDVVDVNGGYIWFETDSSVFTATQTATFASYATTRANEIFDSENDWLLFQSTGDSIEIDNTGTFIQFDASENISFSSAGIFLVNAANDVIVKSDGENQDIYVSTSTGAINTSSITNTLLTADGDFWMTAADGIVFTQSSVDFVMNDDVLLAAEDASINVISEGTSTFGVLLLAGDINLIDVSRDNVLSATSTMASTYTSNDGITMTSSGSSESRRNTAGDSNAHQQLEQAVGFSARTYQPMSHIVFDARASPIDITANSHMFFDTASAMTVESLNEQTYSAGGYFTMESEDGSISFNGATGITIDGTNRDTEFLSYGYTDVIAKQAILLSAEDDIDFTSFHADIEATSFTAADINYSSERFTRFTAGSGMDVFSQGDISMTSGNEFRASAEKGYSLEASGELISFTSVTDGNTVDSSEEIYISAGGDLLMSNPGANLENMKFEAVSSVFTSTGGDMTFSAVELISFDMEEMLVNAFGTSNGKRDRVFFNSPDVLINAGDRGIFVDATEEILLGTATTPSIVTLTAPDHIAFSSIGNIDLTSDNIFDVIGQEFNSVSTAETAFITGALFDITSAQGEIRFATDMLTPSGDSIVDGSISYSVAGDFTTTITNTMLFESLSSNKWDANLMTWVITSNVLVDGAADFSQTVALDYLLTGTQDIRYSIASNSGEMLIDITNDIISTSGDDFTIATNSYLDIDFDGAIGITATTSADYIFTSSGSSLYFDSMEAMTIDANVIGFASLNYDIISLNSDIDILSGDALNIDAKNIWVGAEGNLSMVIATNLNILADEVFQIESANAIDFASSGPTTVTVSAVEIVTLPEGEGDIEFTATGAVTITSIVDLLLTSENELEFDGPVSTITAATDLTFISQGERAGISLRSETITPVFTDMVIIAGDDAARGNFEVTSTTSDINIGTTLTLLADAQENASTSSIHFDTPTGYTLTNTNAVTFFAGADNEGQQGTITLSGNSDYTAVGDILFTAEESSVEFIGDTVTLDAPGTFSVNTHGSDAGIGITVDAFTTANFAGDVSFSAGVNAEFIMENQPSFSLTSGGAMNLLAVGPPTDGFGALFTSSAPDGAIGLQIGTTLDFTSSTGDITSRASDLLEITSVSSTVDATAGDLNFIAQGERVDQTLARPNAVPNNEGIFMSATGPMTLTTTRDLKFTSGQSFDVITDAAITFATTSDTHLFSATGDIELNFGPAVTVNPTNSIFMSAEKGGIQFYDAAALGITINGATEFNSGVGYDDSSATFTGGEGNLVMTVTANDWDIESEANMMVTGYDAIVHNSNNLFFEAATGDMLFRSITVEGPGDGPYDVFLTAGDDIRIEAFERIEHRQHRNLAFFTTPTHANRSADEAPVQGTTIPSLPVVNGRTNGCFCSWSGGSCNEVECPDTTHRILQMQLALINYGLLTL